MNNEAFRGALEETLSSNEEITTMNEQLQNRNDELVEARDYAEAMISTVQVPMVVLDKDLRVKTTNRFFQQTFRVTNNETTGNFIYNLGNGQWNIPELRRFLSEIVTQNETIENFEIDHAFPTIGKKIMLLNARKFYKEGKNILLVIEDITNRREIEKQKDLFIGIASHELKTPLTSMKGFAQILEKRFEKNNNTKDAYLIKRLNDQADKLTNLINDLLNTSKLQKSGYVLEKKKFDLNILIGKSVEAFQSTIVGHTFAKEGDIKMEVYGDEKRIEQVLSNLLTNAVKYSPKASKVIIKTTANNSDAIVSIRDFGFGIKKSDHKKIFERFYRTGTKEELNVSGFGLGLYISAEIIKAHDGRIWVESSKDKGSTFYFTLPLQVV